MKTFIWYFKKHIFYNNRIIRFRLPVGVSYEEDPEIIKKLLLEVADENPNVQKEPKPKVFFEKFGDSSLDFKLGIWTSSHTDKPEFIRSEINYAIFKKFKENNIKIPFPQRDVHIISKESWRKFL